MSRDFWLLFFPKQHLCGPIKGSQTQVSSIFYDFLRSYYYFLKSTPFVESKEFIDQLWRPASALKVTVLKTHCCYISLSGNSRFILLIPTDWLPGVGYTREFKFEKNSRKIGQKRKLNCGPFTTSPKTFLERKNNRSKISRHRLIKSEKANHLYTYKKRRGKNKWTENRKKEKRY